MPEARSILRIRLIRPNHRHQPEVTFFLSDPNSRDMLFMRRLLGLHFTTIQKPSIIPAIDIEAKLEPWPHLSLTLYFMSNTQVVCKLADFLRVSHQPQSCNIINYYHAIRSYHQAFDAQDTFFKIFNPLAVTPLILSINITESDIFNVETLADLFTVGFMDIYRLHFERGLPLNNYSVLPFIYWNMQRDVLIKKLKEFADAIKDILPAIYDKLGTRWRQLHQISPLSSDILLTPGTRGAALFFSELNFSNMSIETLRNMIRYLSNIILLLTHYNAEHRQELSLSFVREPLPPIGAMSGRGFDFRGQRIQQLQESARNFCAESDSVFHAITETGMSAELASLIPRIHNQTSDDFLQLDSQQQALKLSLLAEELHEKRENKRREIQFEWNRLHFPDQVSPLQFRTSTLPNLDEGSLSRLRTNTLPNLDKDFLYHGENSWRQKLYRFFLYLEKNDKY